MGSHKLQDHNEPLKVQPPQSNPPELYILPELKILLVIRNIYIVARNKIKIKYMYYFEVASTCL